MRVFIPLCAALSVCCSAFSADLPKANRKAGLANAARERAGMGWERILTDDQRQKLREYMQQSGMDFRENQEKLAQLRQELNEAALAEKVDEKTIREKTSAIGRIEAEQLRARTLALSKLAPSLSSEQKEQIKALGEQLRAARPGLGARLRNGAPLLREPAAPPPPEK